MTRWSPLWMVLILLGGCAPPETPHVLLATTTSVANSGLLDPLQAALVDQRGIVVRSHLVGSGLALRMLEQGDVDVAITHAPETEAAFLKTNIHWHYRTIMFNDFVLVGPASDAAGARRADNAVAAMRNIATSGVTFISRGDQSGTHEREEMLWRLAGSRPSSGHLVAAGAGMGTTLRVAAETGAYTLTDRATFAQHTGSLSLAIVFEGGAQLLNTYAMIVNPSAQNAAAARDFFVWTTDGSGREVIDGYRISGERAFYIWPAIAPGRTPDATPSVP